MTAGSLNLSRTHTYKNSLPIAIRKHALGRMSKRLYFCVSSAISFTVALSFLASRSLTAGFIATVNAFNNCDKSNTPAAATVNWLISAAPMKIPMIKLLAW